MNKPYKDFTGRLSKRVLARLSLIEAQYNFDYGDEYEVALCEVLSDILPARYGICRGSLVTFDGKEAGDDLVIFDRMSFPTLRSSIAPNFAIKERIPIEAAYAYIECKHRIEFARDLTTSETLAKAVEQVRAVKKIAAERQPNPNNEYNKQDRFQIESHDHWPAYYPSLKNELFGVVFARHAVHTKDNISISDIAVGGQHSPDLLVLGTDYIFSPSVRLNEDGIKASMFFSSAFVNHLLAEKVPGAAIGIGILCLLQTIGWMELKPMDLGGILNKSFWDNLG